MKKTILEIIESFTAELVENGYSLPKSMTFDRQMLYKMLTESHSVSIQNQLPYLDRIREIITSCGPIKIIPFTSEIANFQNQDISEQDMDNLLAIKGLYKRK